MSEIFKLEQGHETGRAMYVSDSQRCSGEIVVTFFVEDRRNGGGNAVNLPTTSAIDLARRILEHFDVLPTKEEVDFIETALLLRKLAMNSEREVKQCTATSAKLRRLVGEEESDASV